MDSLAQWIVQTDPPTPHIHQCPNDYFHSLSVLSMYTFYVHNIYWEFRLFSCFGNWWPMCYWGWCSAVIGVSNALNKSYQLGALSVHNVCSATHIQSFPSFSSKGDIRFIIAMQLLCQLVQDFSVHSSLPVIPQGGDWGGIQHWVLSIRHQFYHLCLNRDLCGVHVCTLIWPPSLLFRLSLQWCCTCKQVFAN